MRVTRNTATASGPTGFAQGAGIWNGVLFNPPPVQLVLVNTRVEENTITATPGVTIARSRALHAVPGHAHQQPNRGERAGRLRRLLTREPVSGRDEARGVLLSRVETLA